jgi:hypothetical protein
MGAAPPVALGAEREAAMTQCLQWISAGFARASAGFAAASAVFWIRSARVTFPVMRAYGGFWLNKSLEPPKTDPNQTAVFKAGSLNFWAASFAAVAAGCTPVAAGAGAIALFAGVG